LANTISRDDIIAVIGANSATSEAAGDGAVCFSGFRLIFKLCQQSAPVPRTIEKDHQISPSNGVIE
jgi:hypothetical protein